MKTKWRAREFTPKNNQAGSHSWFAESVLNSVIQNEELGLKVQARTGVRAYEASMVIAAVAEIIAEETLESNKITMTDGKGNAFVSIYPKVQGSVSDADILAETTAAHAIDNTVEIRSVAQESDLTADRLKWSLGATVGTKFSKQFAIDKQAQKVKYVASDVAINSNEEPTSGEQGGTTPTTNGENSEP